MSADLSISCWGTDGAVTPEYAHVRFLAGIAILAYPVCVPIAYTVLFWNVRHAMWSGQPTELSHSITFLAEEYVASSAPLRPAKSKLTTQLCALAAAGLTATSFSGNLSRSLRSWCW